MLEQTRIFLFILSQTFPNNNNDPIINANQPRSISWIYTNTIQTPSPTSQPLKLLKRWIDGMTVIDVKPNRNLGNLRERYTNISNALIMSTLVTLIICVLHARVLHAKIALYVESAVAVDHLNNICAVIVRSCNNEFLWRSFRRAFVRQQFQLRTMNGQSRRKNSGARTMKFASHANAIAYSNKLARAIADCRHECCMWKISHLPQELSRRHNRETSSPDNTFLQIFMQCLVRAIRPSVCCAFIERVSLSDKNNGSLSVNQPRILASLRNSYEHWTGVLATRQFICIKRLFISESFISVRSRGKFPKQTRFVEKRKAMIPGGDTWINCEIKREHEAVKLVNRNSNRSESSPNQH